MRHFLSTLPVAGLPKRVSQAATSTVLVVPTGLEHLLATRRPSALARAKALPAIAGFADNNLSAAARTKVKAASGLGHRRFPGNAEERESNEVDATRGRCDTWATRVPRPRRWAGLRVQWRCGAELTCRSGRRRTCCFLGVSPFYHIPPQYSERVLRAYPLALRAPGYARNINSVLFAGRIVVARSCRQISALLDRHRQRLPHTLAGFHFLAFVCLMLPKIIDFIHIGS